jgi:hypothetical protein
MLRSNHSSRRSNSEVPVIPYSYPLRPCAHLYERFPSDAIFATATSTSSAPIHFVWRPWRSIGDAAADKVVRKDAGIQAALGLGFDGGQGTLDDPAPHEPANRIYNPV